MIRACGWPLFAWLLCLCIAGVGCTEEPVEESCCWTELGLSSIAVCGLLEDRSIDCWGGITIDTPSGAASPEVRIDELTLAAPEGSYTSLSARLGWGNAYPSCAIDEDSSIVCWGTEYDGVQGTWAYPREGSWAQVDAGPLQGCALSTAGEVECWGTSVENNEGAGLDACEDTRCGFYYPPPGPFERIELNQDDYACGQRPDGSWDCWGALQALPNAPDSSGSQPEILHSWLEEHARRDLDLFWRSVCALDEQGRPFCGSWGGDYLPGYGNYLPGIGGPDYEWRHPEGGYTDVAVGKDHFCLLYPGELPECHAHPRTRASMEGADRVDDPDLVKIYAHEDITCGIRANGVARCWGDEEHGIRFPPIHDAVPTE